MNIFIAKLNFTTTADKLQELFKQYGVVSSSKVIYDKDSKRSKGYGFIEMPNEEEAYNAINALNDAELDGNHIVVKKAIPREQNSPRRSSGQTS